MGVVQVLSACIGCGQPFFYNPLRVPSLRIKGNREPVCANCVARINPVRIANGLPPIVPLPGAYDVCDEAELYG